MGVLVPFLPKGSIMLKNKIVMLAGLRSFVITSKDGAPDNQYRIRNHHVEFRSVAANGPPSPDLVWRVLEPGEVELHFALHTPVADWLDKTLFASQPRAAA
jgi:hypothetical protein